MNKEDWFDGRALLSWAGALLLSSRASTRVYLTLAISGWSRAAATITLVRLYISTRSRKSHLFLLDPCHGCEVVPIPEVLPWCVFRHGFHRGPRIIHITRAREPLINHTTVMGTLVHGVGLPQEDS